MVVKELVVLSISAFALVDGLHVFDELDCLDLTVRAKKTVSRQFSRWLRMKTLNCCVPFERGFLGEEELQMDLPNIGIGLSGVLDPSYWSNFSIFGLEGTIHLAAAYSTNALSST